MIVRKLGCVSKYVPFLLSTTATWVLSPLDFLESLATRFSKHRTTPSVMKKKAVAGFVV